MRRPFFAANWKMNKMVDEVRPFVSHWTRKIEKSDIGRRFDVSIAPPYTHLTLLIDSVRGLGIKVAAQNCGPAKSGAFTGEVSPWVLAALGCAQVIIGHSERRHVFKEDETLLESRCRAALEAEMEIIFCLGEKLDERQKGVTFRVIDQQLSCLTRLPGKSLSRITIAYEPVWAIGTGENATPDQAQEVHHYIRTWVGRAFMEEVASNIRILYGGSVKADNSESLMMQPDVDGLLVGGASLEGDSFAALVLQGIKGKESRKT